VFAASLALLASAPVVVAASSIVECGQVVAFTAPDSGTATDGSLTLGILPAWVIDADAVIGTSAAAVLPSFAGSGPSCLTLDLDGAGAITALDFAAEGTLTGPVVVDSGLGGFVFDDRILIPSFITDAYPGLAAVFATSAATDAKPTATFFVDTSTGQFTGFDARAAFCGDGDLAGNGDGLVGAAKVPAAVLDAADIAILKAANGDEVCASIHAIGTIGGSGLSIDTDVKLTSMPNTSTRSASGAPATAIVRPIGLGIAVAMLLLLLRLGPAAGPSGRPEEHQPSR
jgi:hypothetical protein